MANDQNAAPTTRDFLAVARRLLVWAVFLGILYYLRDFLLLIFLTFVFVYSAGRAVRVLEARSPKIPRPLLVTAVFLGILGLLTGVGFLLVPGVKSEVDRFSEQFPAHRDSVIQAYKDFAASHPQAAGVADAVIRQFVDIRENLETLGQVKTETSPRVETAPAGHLPIESLTVAVNWIYTFVASLISAVVTVFMAILFAFLILIDSTTIQREVKGLETSRVGWLYKEVRESIIEVGESVGRILEAQFLISLIETVLIVIALWILGVPSLFLLGVLTFFLGLVPVLGGVFAAVPLAWVAFTGGGTPLLVKSLIVYAVIRGVAGYTIEPKIFGRRFHINTVFILVILLIGYKAAGIWGVLLGLPVAYAIIRPRGPQNDGAMV